jgi:hypothetical protein
MWICFVLMPIRIWLSTLMLIQVRIRIHILPQVLHLFENSNFFFNIYSQQYQVTLFCISRQRYKFHDFQYFGPPLKFSGKRASLALHLDSGSGSTKMMPILPDPDLPKWCRSYRIRIHNTGLYRLCDIVGMFAVVRFFVGLFTLLHRAASCPWSDDQIFLQRLLAHWSPACKRPTKVLRH